MSVRFTSRLKRSHRRSGAQPVIAGKKRKAIRHKTRLFPVCIVRLQQQWGASCPSGSHMVAQKVKDAVTCVYLYNVGRENRQQWRRRGSYQYSNVMQKTRCGPLRCLTAQRPPAIKPQPLSPPQQSCLLSNKKRSVRPRKGPSPG